LVGNPKGKRLPGKPSHRWENNIKSNVKQRWCESVDWIYVVQNWEQ
jgi:hypothetical protein